MKKDFLIFTCPSHKSLFEFNLQLQAQGYTNIDGLDDSAQMLKEAKKKNIYKKIYHVRLGPYTITEIKKGTEAL